MKKRRLAKRDPIKNYFPLPNEIYSLGLSSTAIAVYGYLLRREDRKTYQCVASYRMIGDAIGKCANTVRKYVTELEARGLICTERTTITTRDGRTRNGCLLYTILPIQLAIEQYYDRQLSAIDLERERCAAEKRMEKAKNAGNPRDEKEAGEREGVVDDPSRPLLPAVRTFLSNKKGVFSDEKTGSWRFYSP